MIVNGGFEVSDSPWIGSGNGYLYTSNGDFPHGGTGFVFLGVNNNASGQVYQTVSIPADAAGSLSFWLNVTSNEPGNGKARDVLFAEVRNASGALLATLATYSNLDRGAAGAYSQKSFDVSGYRGQTIRVQFRTTSDNSRSTTFRVDDVSLQ